MYRQAARPSQTHWLPLWPDPAPAGRALRQFLLNPDKPGFRAALADALARAGLAALAAAAAGDHGPGELTRLTRELWRAELVRFFYRAAARLRPRGVGADVPVGVHVAKTAVRDTPDAAAGQQALVSFAAALKWGRAAVDVAGEVAADGAVSFAARDDPYR